MKKAAESRSSLHFKKRRAKYVTPLFDVKKSILQKFNERVVYLWTKQN